MIPILVSGLVALIAAALFLSVVLAKVGSTPLWIIFLGGIVLMAVNLIDELRHSEDQS